MYGKDHEGKKWHVMIIRGGIGRRMTIKVHDGKYAPMQKTAIAVQAGRFIYPPEGIFNGKPGARARYLKNDENADPSGLTFCDVGDSISFHSAGVVAMVIRLRVIRSW